MNTVAEIILDNLPYPVVYCNNAHIIEYMNKSAIERYADSGGAELVGKSIMDCHNDESRNVIINNYNRLLSGEDEIYESTTKDNFRTYMSAVRSKNGDMLGYYERFEPIVK
jgi:nitrogen-specific signal transduction histidine kinase